jgi:hypothetical protein
MTSRRFVSFFFAAAMLCMAAACTKHASTPQVVVEIPAGFNGNFVLEMGSREAAALPTQGEAYVVAVPRAGKLTTSTLLQKPKVTFRNESDGSVWGYSESIVTTGDGIPVGGRIEFFVGTRKEYEAEQSRKNHSGRSLPSEEMEKTGA